MGLDQYAYKRKVEWADNHKTKITTDNELMTWRKHNRLQGWFENRESGDINCRDVYVSLDDILQLERDVEHNNLPATTGFFFGNDSYDEKGNNLYKEQDKEFIKEAKKALNEGFDVVYSCWY
jgi:hypothetical protein